MVACVEPNDYYSIAALAGKISINRMFNEYKSGHLKIRARVLVVLLVIFSLTNAVAQKIVSYPFDKYPVSEIYKGPKADVNLKSSETAKIYRTQIKNQYKSSVVEFAGKYSMIFWGAGPGGLTLGAMVDNSTGIVYDLPLTAENSSRGCWDSGMENNILYKKNSKLFITWTCEEEINAATKSDIVTKYFSFFLWNETKKKFILLKNESETKTQTINK